MTLTITIPDDKACDVLQFIAGLQATPVKTAEPITGRQMTACGKHARITGPGSYGLKGEIEFKPGDWREYHWNQDGTSGTGYQPFDLIAQ